MSYDNKELYEEVLRKGTLKRTKNLMGVIGSIVGHSILVTCDACKREGLTVFISHKGTDLCFGCMARIEEMMLSFPQKAEPKETESL